MPIYRFLREATYGPDEIRVMAAAYENALHTLRLIDRTDPVTEVVAKKIIDIWGRGERDAHRIAALAFDELGQPPPADTTAAQGGDR